ncbi:MAG TPA: MFS transporter [Gemmatimonadales bacterium]|nr:MFS transporter [Gemmatimonadales bacterium]
MAPPAPAARPAVALGLRANARQFALLVLINAFVGALVGLERSVLPLLADAEFGVASRRALLAFIASFGLAKAGANLLAGHWGDRYGRRRVLVLGWLLGIPVPLLVIWAPSWGWVVAANLLLGLNQGLAWSTTVVMKIDLAGPRRRGLAMGLNEFAGYLAVAGAALAAGLIADRFGYRPAPFYLGLAIATAGLALTLLFVRDTSGHVRHESRTHAPDSAGSPPAPTPTLREIVARVSRRDSAMASASQAGLVNNLNDGLAWGLFPVFFAAEGLDLRRISLLAFVYPAVWGTAQLLTGPASDRWGRKWLIVGGMVLQGLALAAIARGRGAGAYPWWLASSVLLGLGTAMVYPTLLAAIGDVAAPAWRSSAVGVYRLWRDLGYVVGALTAGLVADAFGMRAAIYFVAGLTAASGVLAAMRMPETLGRGGDAAARSIA